MLRFSLKEAVYKSIEPELNRYVSYKEIEVQPSSDGYAVVINKLAAPRKEFHCVAQWKKFKFAENSLFVPQKYWVSCVHSSHFTPSN
jgi:phosphopantetheinyl transferase (holo-ACP synthase)